MANVLLTGYGTYLAAMSNRWKLGDRWNAQRWLQRLRKDIEEARKHLSDVRDVPRIGQLEQKVSTYQRLPDGISVHRV